MRIIPSIDLRGGRSVQLVGGQLSDERVSLPDPVEVAANFERDGADIIHVVDLDRAFGRGNNLTVIRAIIERVNVPVQVGGGIRLMEDINDLLDAGAAKVVLGTRAVTEPEFLKDAASRYGDRLTVAVDAKGDEIVTKAWTEPSGEKLLEFAQRVDGLGIGAFLYTDVGREGRLQGPNVESVRALTDRVETRVLASGGIRSVDDLQALKQADAWGAVIGMALYTGAFTLQEAKEAVQ